MKVKLSELVDRMTIVDIKLDVLRNRTDAGSQEKSAALMGHQAALFQAIFDTLADEGLGEYSPDELVKMAAPLRQINEEIFHLLDIVLDDNEPDDRVAAAARKAQKMNLDRSRLKVKIDASIGKLSSDMEIKL